MKTRNVTIDACKGLAILLVMAGHMLILNQMEDPYVYDVIKVIQMPFFMVISGYLCGMGRHVTNVKEYVQVLKKRAVAYLTPFFVWIVIQSPEAPLSSVWAILFDTQAGLWFLMTLFVLTVMVYTAQLAEAKWKSRKAFFAVYLFLAALVTVQSFTGFTFLSPGLTRLYIPFYMAGYLAYVYQQPLQKLLTPGRRTGLFVCSLAAFTCLVIAENLNDMSTLRNLAVQTIASFLGCYLVVYLMMHQKDGKAKNFLSFTGQYTLELYVLHFHFARLLYPKDRVLNLYSLEGILFVVAGFVVMAVITVVLIWLIKKVWILDLLLFGKQRKK